MSVAPAEALWRAMPPTRLLDGGMDYADVLALQARTASGEAWDRAAEQLADVRLARQVPNPVTALEELRYAAADLLFAQMAYNFDVPRKVSLYDRFTSAVARAAELAQWERVQLPFAGGRLFGWLIRPTGPIAGTVVVFGGQSGWGATYLSLADALTRRGMAALLAEGPGQGETRMHGGVLLDVDVRAAYSTFVDHALLHGPVGLWGNSMGGLYAGTTAASDPRVAAVCINGAPATPRLLGFRTFDEQACAMLGTRDHQAVQENFARLALRADDRIRGAVLVLHGGADPIVRLEEQKPFLAAAEGVAHLQVWEDGEHTIYNHAAQRTAFAADWFAERFREETG
ncbi:alpha/beta hydrolase [Amycolatopsis jejuensis]|uniref:alpha/beta hydrolase n=1 Tax=Amycolatopsis jejuensis TaxID=330084 RepID=UPI000525D3CB|nr:prolyl oligopeptidase family serine peptidase [Amycolatopsis jejuensis]